MPVLSDALPLGGAASNVVDAGGTTLIIDGISVTISSMPDFAFGLDFSTRVDGLNGTAGLTVNSGASGSGELTVSVVAGSVTDAALYNALVVGKVVPFVISDSNGRRKYVGQCALKNPGSNATDAGMRPYVFNCINVNHVNA